MRSLLAGVGRRSAFLASRRLAPAWPGLRQHQPLGFGAVTPAAPQPLPFSARCLARAASSSSGAASASADAPPAKPRRGRKKAAEPASPVDAAPDSPPPSATAERLASSSAAAASALPAPQPFAWNAPPGPAWDAPQRWVVFSDLHVSRRTLDVCLEVLRKVRLFPPDPPGPPNPPGPLFVHVASPLMLFQPPAHRIGTSFALASSAFARQPLRAPSQPRPDAARPAAAAAAFVSAGGARGPRAGRRGALPGRLLARPRGAPGGAAQRDPRGAPRTLGQ